MRLFHSGCHLVICLVLSTTSLAQKLRPGLAAAAIPLELTQNAEAVLRYDSTELEILSPTRVIYRQHYAITILSRAGSRWAELSAGYSLMHKITQLEAWTYDRDGKLIERAREKDFRDRSTFGMGAAFHSDQRLKTYTFNEAGYPFTVVFKSETEMTSNYFLPAWNPKPAAAVSVENAYFSVLAPGDALPRLKFYNQPEALQYTEATEGHLTRKSWRTGDLRAFTYQPFAAYEYFRYPRLSVVSDSFNLLGHPGSLHSWESFSQFYFELNKDRDQLPESVAQQVKAIIGEDTSTTQVVQSLYNYMQSHTRYVGNQFGISGWQSFRASEVCAKGYGDCKGLTNYLKALLQIAGIPAYPVLIDAGERNFRQPDPEFPTNSFNHVILCVPDGGDTIWVECTDPYLPAGYLGSFTQDRLGLLTSETGGRLLSTPVYGKPENKRLRKLRLAPRSEGAYSVELSSFSTGYLQEDLFQFLKRSNAADIEKRVRQKFKFPSYDVDSFSYSFGRSGKIPTILETAHIEARGISTQSGDLTLLRLNWMPIPFPKLHQTADSRTLPIELRHSYEIIDSIEVALDGFELAASLPDYTLEFPFARYKVSSLAVADRVYVIRHFEQIKGVYPPGQLDNFKQVYAVINQSQQFTQLALKATQAVPVTAGQ